MKAIFELIKSKIATCVKNGDMFDLPSEVEQYVTSHEDISLQAPFWLDIYGV